jgi:hypothetical protein
MSMQVHRRRLAMGATLVGALALMLPSAALAIGTLDQEQAQADAPLIIDSNPVDQVDQEFTAGRTGVLDTVALFISRPDTLDATFHVEIRDPGPDTSLASGTIPAADTPATQGGGWVNVTDWGGAPASVVAGQKYVIRVQWLDSGNGDYSWWRSEGKTYAAGDTIIDSVVQEGQSMAFRTYVTGAAPSTRPSPSAIVTLPPTSTVTPATPVAPVSSTLALVAILGLVAAGSLVVAGRRSRS